MAMRVISTSRYLTASALTLALGLTLGACGSHSASTDASSTQAASEHAHDGHHDDHDGHEGHTEVAHLEPRAVIAYDGGIQVLDTGNGEVLADIKKDGFLRLNPAGDGRHVLVTSSAGFEVLDTGLIAQAHGDHYHYYVTEPRLTGSVIPADHGGHVVTHAGRTSVFADGTGTVSTFDLSALDDGEISADELTTFTTESAHHGVAVPLSNGGWVHTHGTKDERHTIRARAADGTTQAETTACPGVHGEATAAPSDASEDILSFGCEDGPVVYSGGEFHKVSVPEEYQRSGNQAGSPASPVVLTDYKVVRPTKGGDPEHPTRIGLLNTQEPAISTVELGSPYWFRSLGRGRDGEAVVLTGDGTLHIIDPTSAQQLHHTAVVTPWTENADWQQPGPNLRTVGNIAYVTDPQARTLSLVQISTGELLSTLNLSITPNEMAVIDPAATL